MDKLPKFRSFRHLNVSEGQDGTAGLVPPSFDLVNLHLVQVESNLEVDAKEAPIT